MPEMTIIIILASRFFLPLRDGSPDLWDGQPLPPETVGDAAGVSHALHMGGVVCVGPPPTEHVDHVAPGKDTNANENVHMSKKPAVRSHVALTFSLLALSLPPSSYYWESTQLRTHSRTSFFPQASSAKNARRTGPGPI